ncbi:MAG TPA: tetratricopeptide repeat protein [Acetobacteraceae bacterium]|nr:tetratricopeptide repeat protein [Acetobacteraceae bacterium]
MTTTIATAATDATEADLRETLLTDPEHGETNARLGRLLLDRNQPHDAFPLLLAALKARPDAPGSWLNIQEALIGAHMFDAARALVSQAQAAGLDEATLARMHRMVDEGTARSLSLPALLPAEPTPPAPTRPASAPRRRGPMHQKALRLLARGDRAMAEGRVADAEADYRKAVAASRDCDGAWNHLGNLLLAQERLVEAEDAYRAGLAADPDAVNLRLNLAILLQRQGRLAQAEEAARHVLQLDPDCGSAHLLLGVCLTARRQHVEAEGVYRRAIQIRAVEHAALCGLSLVLSRLNRLGEAEAAIRKAVALKPGETGSLCALGDLMLQLHRPDEAEGLFRKAMAGAPREYAALIGLGRALARQGRPAEAEPILARAIGANPTHDDGYMELALVIGQQDRPEEAEACLQRGVERNPASLRLRIARSKQLLDQGRAEEAVRNLREGLRLDPENTHPNNVDARGAVLFALLHQARPSPEEVLAEHLAAGRLMEAGITPHVHVPRAADADRRPRLGFVSGDLFGHVVAHFLERAWEGLKRRGFEIHAYSSTPLHKEDSVTRRFRGMATRWTTISDIDDPAVADMIREDGVDILFNLTGYTGNYRLGVFAHRPAPLQVAWIGYPGTTGMSRMDYYLCDHAVAPRGVVDWQMTEKLVRLPVSTVFDPRRTEPAVSPLPALSGGIITFGSFNRLSKMTDRVVRTWSRILDAVPGSQLLVGALADAPSRAKAVAAFAGQGIPTDRLLLRPYTDLESYLTQFHEADVLLDTFPYAGGTTTCFGLWMGVPTLTLSGKMLHENTGASLMTQVGLGEFVAGSEDEYVAKAVSWAHRVQELSTLRSQLRARVEERLVSPERLLDGMDVALQTMWQRWCAGLPVESFDVALPNPGSDRAPALPTAP